MFGFIKKGLQKTIDVIKNIVPEKKEKIEKSVIEEILIECDMEYDVVEMVLNDLPDEISRDRLFKALHSLFAEKQIFDMTQKPFVDLIIGVNGAGKTTTIAKLAKKAKDDGLKVMLGAGDTFRAAAIEQLKRWADKIDVPIVYTKQGHDPSAVAYDTIASAVARGYDRVIIDTAGRLQTQTNLSNELKKIVKISNKALENAPHRKILILDGTQGNSAILQASAFHEIVGVDGIIITKLDGTAKGGALFSISSRLKLPILYVGVGEKESDLIEFSPEEFVNSILDTIYKAEAKETNE
ncbi:MAG: signal recognition particle-docking protein FtsY [Campylobacterales bacterium]|nr:signal recognition particle-docking protein FtsY [Campylobacterales bacterium]